jgi:U3 small nucleolar RNA-associated protein 22
VLCIVCIISIHRLERLVRSLKAQLIDSHLWPDESTEIIIAEMFLKTGVQPAIQPQTGFFRFSAQLANTD